MEPSILGKPDQLKGSLEELVDVASTHQARACPKRFTIIIHKQYAYGREAPDPDASEEEGSVSRVRLAEGLNLRIQTCLQIISYLVSFPVPFASPHVTISGPSVPF